MEDEDKGRLQEIIDAALNSLKFHFNDFILQGLRKDALEAYLWEVKVVFYPYIFKTNKRYKIFLNEALKRFCLKHSYYSNPALNEFINLIEEMASNEKEINEIIEGVVSNYMEDIFEKEGGING